MSSTQLRRRRRPSCIVLGVASLVAAYGCGREPTPPQANGPFVITYRYLAPSFRYICSESAAYVTTADGRSRRRFDLGSVHACSSIRWSPDGKRLVFEGYDPTAGRDGIYVMNADGSNLFRVPSTLDLRAPIWTPDGSALTVFSPSGFANIRPDGTGFTPVVAGVDVGPASWSPDGKTLLFNAYPDVWTANADGTGRHMLITDASAERWSPDGTRILFAGVNTRSGVWLARADGSEQRQISAISPAAFASDGLAWAPDGHRIVLMVQIASGGTELMVIDTAGGAPKQITSGPPKELTLSPDWSPIP